MTPLFKEPKDPYREYFESSTGVEGSATSVRSFVDAFRSMSPEERAYYWRRVGVIIFGLAIPFVIIGIISSLFFSDAVGGRDDGVRIVEGAFAVKIERVAAISALPGKAPDALISVRWHDESWRGALRCPIGAVGDISDSYVEFVTDEVAFTTIDKLYAVTTDGGAGWTARVIYRDGSSALGAHREENSLSIGGVVMNPDGQGLLFPVGVTALDKVYTTNDFGMTWRPPGWKPEILEPAEEVDGETMESIDPDIQPALETDTVADTAGE